MEYNDLDKKGSDRKFEREAKDHSREKFSLQWRLEAVGGHSRKKISLQRGLEGLFLYLVQQDQNSWAALG